MKRTKRILAIILLLALTVTLCACGGNTYTVTVKYLDENGNEIAEPYVYTGKKGERYDVAAQVEKDIECYEKTAVNGATKGTLGDNTELTVRYAQTAPLSYENYLSERWRDVEWVCSVNSETENYVSRQDYPGRGTGIYKKDTKTKIAECTYLSCILETNAYVFYAYSFYDEEQLIYTSYLCCFDTKSFTVRELDRVSAPMIDIVRQGPPIKLSILNVKDGGIMWANEYVVLYATHKGFYAVDLFTQDKHELLHDESFADAFNMLAFRPLSNTEIVFVRLNSEFLSEYINRVKDEPFKHDNLGIIIDFASDNDVEIGAYDYYVLDILTGEVVLVGTADAPYSLDRREGVELFFTDEYKGFIDDYLNNKY